MSAPLLRKFDALAQQQIFAEMLRLSAENDRLTTENTSMRARLGDAEESAEFWHDQAIELQFAECDRRGGSPGINVEGRLLVVTPLANDGSDFQ